MLARDVRYLIEGQLQGLRQAYRTAHGELVDIVDPGMLDDKMGVYALQAAPLQALLAQVKAVEEASVGVRWVPKQT
jgi:hypothetical protein